MQGQTLPKKPSESIRTLAAAHDAERLRLAAAGAREAVFDWTMADDRITWDGAVDLFDGASGQVLRRTAAVNNRRAATRLTSSRVLMDRMHAMSCWKTEV